MVSSSPPRRGTKGSKDFLRTCDFFNSTTDSSLFIRRNQEWVVYVLIYVDDFVITRDCEMNVRGFINVVCSQLRCRDLGELSYFLGLEMNTTTNDTRITQRKYSLDLLTRFKMADSKPISTPGSHLATNSGTPLPDPTSDQHHSTGHRIRGKFKYVNLCRFRPPLTSRRPKGY